jgi:hypothetical protein
VEVGEPLGDLDDRPAGAAPDVEQPAAGLEPLAEVRELRQDQVEEDARQRLEPLGDLAHEGLVVLLVGRGRPGPEVLDVAGIVLADLHVHARRAGEVEARLGGAQDLVEVRRHPPAVAVTLDQPERERGAAQHVGVEGVGAEPLGELRGADPRVPGERLPGAQLAGDLDEMGRVVPADQVVESADLLGQRRRRRGAVIRHGASSALIPREQGRKLGRAYRSG